MPKERANQLDGRDWLRNSISIWSDIRKTPTEAALGHPAMFPQMLVDRLFDCFVRPGDQVVLDPFGGSGSTLLAACERGLDSIGVELSTDYIRLADQRLTEAGHQSAVLDDGKLQDSGYVLLQADARQIHTLLAPGCVDFCVTSPPYWNILRQRRSADGKSKRYYGDRDSNLGEIDDYSTFLCALQETFSGVWKALRPGGYCCVVVMDLRKRARFFPLHQDVADLMQSLNFVYDDLIVWDRRSEYNNLRPLGYPYKFRINKVHEFILVFEKPASP